MKPPTMPILRKNQMVKKHMALMTTPLTTINLMMIPATKQSKFQTITTQNPVKNTERYIMNAPSEDFRLAHDVSDI